MSLQKLCPGGDCKPINQKLQDSKFKFEFGYLAQIKTSNIQCFHFHFFYLLFY